MLNGNKSYLLSFTALFSKKGYELALGVDTQFEDVRDTRYHLTAPAFSTYRTLILQESKHARKSPYLASSLFGYGMKEASNEMELDSLLVQNTYAQVVSYLSSVQEHLSGDSIQVTTGPFISPLYAHKKQAEAETVRRWTAAQQQAGDTGFQEAVPGWKAVHETVLHKLSGYTLHPVQLWMDGQIQAGISLEAAHGNYETGESILTGEPYGFLPAESVSRIMDIPESPHGLVITDRYEAEILPLTDAENRLERIGLFQEFSAAWNTSTDFAGEVMLWEGYEIAGQGTGEEDLISSEHAPGISASSFFLLAGHPFKDGWQEQLQDILHRDELEGEQVLFGDEAYIAVSGHPLEKYVHSLKSTDIEDASNGQFTGSGSMAYRADEPLTFTAPEPAAGAMPLISEWMGHRYDPQYEIYITELQPGLHAAMPLSELEQFKEAGGQDRIDVHHLSEPGHAEPVTATGYASVNISAETIKGLVYAAPEVFKMMRLIEIMHGQQVLDLIEAEIDNIVHHTLRERVSDATAAVSDAVKDKLHYALQSYKVEGDHAETVEADHTAEGSRNEWTAANGEAHGIHREETADAAAVPYKADAASGLSDGQFGAEEESEGSGFTETIPGCSVESAADTATQPYLAGVDASHSGSSAALNDNSHDAQAEDAAETELRRDAYVWHVNVAGLNTAEGENTDYAQADALDQAEAIRSKPVLTGIQSEADYTESLPSIPSYIIEGARGEDTDAGRSEHLETIPAAEMGVAQQREAESEIERLVKSFSIDYSDTAIVGDSAADLHKDITEERVVQANGYAAEGLTVEWSEAGTESADAGNALHTSGGTASDQEADRSITAGANRYGTREADAADPLRAERNHAAEAELTKQLAQALNRAAETAVQEAVKAGAHSKATGQIFESVEAGPAFIQEAVTEYGAESRSDTRYEAEEVSYTAMQLQDTADSLLQNASRTSGEIAHDGMRLNGEQPADLQIPEIQGRNGQRLVQAVPAHEPEALGNSFAAGSKYGNFESSNEELKPVAPANSYEAESGELKNAGLDNSYEAENGELKNAGLGNSYEAENGELKNAGLGNSYEAENGELKNAGLGNSYEAENGELKNAGLGNSYEAENGELKNAGLDDSYEAESGELKNAGLGNSYEAENGELKNAGLGNSYEAENGELKQAVHGNSYEAVSSGLDQAVAGNSYEAISGGLDQAVAGNSYEGISGGLDQAVAGNSYEGISGGLEQAVAGNSYEAISCGVEQAVAGNSYEAISGGLEQAVAGNSYEAISGGLEQAVAGNSYEALSGELEQAVAGNSYEAISGGLEQAAAGNSYEALSGELEQAVAGNSYEAINGRLEQAVAGNSYEALSGGLEQAVAGNSYEAISGGLEQAVAGNSYEAISGGLEQAVAGNSYEAISGGLEQAVAGNSYEALSGGLEQAVAGNSYEALSGELEQAVAGNSYEALSGGLEQAVAGNSYEAISGGLEQAVAGNSYEALSGELEQAVAGNSYEALSR
ncbi:hypothetical protein, partial [Paenibacillus tengchongensis]|uniref:hypothetical protein n=1 Tax=Paenibacillus tengchongensis TaxID=2608684 RepID=UPI00124C8A3F